MRKFKIALRVLLKSTRIYSRREPKLPPVLEHTIFMYGMLFTFKPSFLQMVSTLRARLSLPATFLLMQRAHIVFGITPRGKMLRRTFTRAHRM